MSISQEGLQRLKDLAENDDGAWVDFHGDLWDFIAFYEAAKAPATEQPPASTTDYQRGFNDGLKGAFAAADVVKEMVQERKSTQQPDDCRAVFEAWSAEQGWDTSGPEARMRWATWQGCWTARPEREAQQPDEKPLAKARTWPGLSRVELLQIATNAFCQHNPPGYNWDSRALEAACKAYHEAATPEQPVDTSDIAHKLEYAFPQISLSALSDIIEYFRPYLRQPERDAQQPDELSQDDIDRVAVAIDRAAWDEDFYDNERCDQDFVRKVALAAIAAMPSIKREYVEVEGCAIRNGNVYIGDRKIWGGEPLYRRRGSDD